ncbi:hypothetical protein [Pinirhizobacter sp.]|jgi:hypothetical protein|uniref:hypothetical protein n=1 Tax=Pinirhizobacter sp. TaxID=2950432 RepID=UPI002F3F3EC5
MKQSWQLILRCSALATALACAGCNDPSGPKPTASAVWVGSADGGAWIDCHPMEARRFRCAIYGNTKNLLQDSEFLTYRSFDIASLREQYGSYAGDEIVLKDDTSLKRDPSHTHTY